jgi:pSer/pThr/pTyr-binding forkhead associated (FHA) protein
MNIRLAIAAGPGAPTTFEHAGPVVRIGRDPECDLALQGEAGDAVSRRHAQIQLSAGGATVTDLGSSNGTQLNGVRLEAPAPLRVGDQIQMGFTGATLTVLALDLGPAAAPKAVRVPRAVLFGSLAAAALVVVVGGVIVAQKLKAGNGSAPAASTEQAVAVAPPVAETGKPPPPPPPPTAVKLPLALPPPIKGAPNEEVKNVGKYVALKGWDSVLLQRQGEAFPWVVLRPEEPVSTAQTLVSLPGYWSLIALDSGVHLTLWGNLPEFSAAPPVLESVVMLYAPSEKTDLDFTLDRGRVVVTNRKEPAAAAHVRVRFLGESWDLELADDRSEAALQLWGIPQRATAGAGRAAPPTFLELFTKGRVRVTTRPGKVLDLGDRSYVRWLNQDAAPPDRTDLPELPRWWATKPDRKSKDVEKALRSLLDWRDLLTGPGPRPGEKKPPAEDAEPLVARVKKQVQDVNDPDNQDVGVFFLAALDEVEPLVDLLGEKDKPNVRGTARYALQTWLSRGGQHADELKRILERRGVGDADLVVRLMHFYPPEALTRRETYEELAHNLDNGTLAVRDLAFWHLLQLVVGGFLPREAAEIAYNPTWDAEKRKAGVERWRQLVASAPLPAAPRR